MIDPAELEAVRWLVTSDVRFLIVGGRAVKFYLPERTAGDLDLLIEVSRENWPKLDAILLSLGHRVRSFDEVAPGKRYQVQAE